MASSKSPKKSRKLQGVAVDPSLRGRGPAKGAPNAGRPPNAFKERIEALGDRWLVALEVGRIVDDPESPHFRDVGKWLVEQIRGKAKQAVEVTGVVSIASELDAARKRALDRTET